jgi:hypothetical protein
MLRIALPWTAALLACAALPAPAQTLRGRLVEQGSKSPIGGAAVLVLDTAGVQVGGVFTDASGHFTVQLPTPGRYHLRAERIGYRSVTSPLLELRAGQLLEYALEAPAEGVLLTEIVVRREPRCTVRPEEGARTARVWEEARKALTAAALVQSQKSIRYEARTYERTLDPKDLRVRREQLRRSAGNGSQPFVSLPAERLRAEGFARITPQGSVYYAPDAQVLLSDDFLDTHCFRLTAGRDRELIGLAFEPVPGRRVPEIRGTLWLHRETAELRHLEYGYTNLELEVPTDKLGGRVEFARLPGGGWIARRWSIRMPEVGVRPSHDWSGRQRAQQELISLREEGGEVLWILTPEGEPIATAELAVLAGTVHDSTRAAPLAGAVVVLEGTEHSTATTGAGHFRLTGLPEGRYSVTFSHPRLDSLGAPSLPAVGVVLRRGEETAVQLAVPPLARILAAACPEPPGRAEERGRMPGDEIGILTGTVRDAMSGAPLPGAAVTATWSRWRVEDDRERYAVTVRQADAGFQATTDERGHYRMCEVPALIPVVVRAHLAGRASEPLQVKLRANQPTLQELAVPARTASAMPDSAVAVEGVVVRGYTRRAEAARRRATPVRLLTPDDVDRLRPGARHLGDLLRTLPGVTVREGGSADSGLCIEVMRRIRSQRTARGCEMVKVFVDDASVVDPEQELRRIPLGEVESVEVLSPSEAGATYGTGAGTGVLLLYTRGNGPYARRKEP